MQTRRLRLGDVVDDYCPRERRLSNHVVVAMVDDAIKQTRCTTCDFEHPYKDGKLPTRRKKKDATAELYQQVLEGMTEKPPSAPIVVVEETPVETPVAAPMAMAAGASRSAAAASAALRPATTNLRTKTKAKTAAAAAAAPTPAPVAAPAPVAPPPAAPEAPVLSAPVIARRAAAPSVSAPPAVSTSTPPARIAPSNGEAPRLAPAPPIAAAPQAVAAPEPPAAETDEDGQPLTAGGENEPLHRRTLIRAQLPRPVGEVPTRQAPTFTIREAAKAPKFRRPFARNARPQGGQNGVGNSVMGRSGPRNGQQPRGKKGGAPGAHRFGQSQGQGSGGGHHAKGRQQGNQGNKRFK